MREREAQHSFISSSPSLIPYELTGGQFRVQRRSTEGRGLLGRTESAPVQGEKGSRRIPVI